MRTITPTYPKYSNLLPRTSKPMNKLHSSPIWQDMLLGQYPAQPIPQMTTIGAISIINDRSDTMLHARMLSQAISGSNCASHI